MTNRFVAVAVITASLIASQAIGVTSEAGAAETLVSPPVGTSNGTLGAGVLLDHGKALADADVVAVAWPNQHELQQLRTGDVVPTYVLGRAKTDKTGRFAIAAQAASLPAKFRGEADQVDIELVFGDATREARWHYSAAPTGVASQASWALRGPTGGRGPSLHADLGDGVVYDTGNDPAAWIGSNGKALGAAARGAAALDVTPVSRSFSQLRTLPLEAVRAELANSAGSIANVPPRAPTEICQAYASTIHYGLSEYFMQAYAWSGAYATVTEQYGNDHTLGVGYSATGSEAGFHANGTMSTNMTASASRGGVADAYVYNKVNYRDYGDTCGTAVQRKPYSVNALLTNFTYTPHVTYSTCTTYTGGTYTKSQGSNYTYSGGMDIGPVNVSAQSGWNSNTEIGWTVTKRTKLCGSSSAGWVSSANAAASAG